MKGRRRRAITKAENGGVVAPTKFRFGETEITMEFKRLGVPETHDKKRQ